MERVGHDRAAGGHRNHICLEVFDWPYDEADKDANFKQEVAAYTLGDPMSTELIARYVMPRFQGSLERLQMSQDFFGGTKEELAAQRERALALAGTDHDKATTSWQRKRA